VSKDGDRFRALDLTGVIRRGIQEETTMLQVPGLTLRENNERPVTGELGSNRLAGITPERIAAAPALAEDAFYRIPLTQLKFQEGRVRCSHN
jgi:UDP-N-acetylglucosamine 2-epimerase